VVRGCRGEYIPHRVEVAEAVLAAGRDEVQLADLSSSK
jgi:hypothetical protein